MEMRRVPSVACAIALLAVVPGHASHSETRRYVAGIGDVTVLLCSEQPTLGGACFDVPSGHSTVRVRIIDATSMLIGGAWRFEAADGTALLRGAFCGQTTPIGIPTGARTLTVFVDSARSAVDCLPAIAGPGTTGDVTATWGLGSAGPGDGGPPVPDPRDLLTSVP